MTALTGAGWYFCASHYDDVRQELHGHTYEVVAWWPADPSQDALMLQRTLQNALAAFDHKTLPPEITRAEDLRKAIVARLTGCVGLDIGRPVERLFVSWRA